MSAEEKKFSHILVSNDEDTDEIIQAGSFSQRDQVQKAPLEAEAEQREESFSEAHVEEEADQEEQTPLNTEEESTQASSSKEAYSPTTLEDLQGGKMGGVQRAVIIVAILGLIAFFIYYICFM